MRSRVVGIVVLALLAFPAASWSATPASCATPPPNYTGTDATVAALTQLDQDEDANCKAVTDRLDQVDGDVTSAATQAHTDSGALHDQLATANGTLSGWTSSNPLQVQLPSSGGSGQDVQVTNWPNDQTVGLDSTSSGQIDGIGQSTHGDLWVIVGAIIGCFLFSVALRKLWP